MSQLHIPSLVEVVNSQRKLTTPWIQFFVSLVAPLNQGYSGTIATAKLTVGGMEGSMTFTNGVLTAQTAAT